MDTSGDEDRGEHVRVVRESFGVEVFVTHVVSCAIARSGRTHISQQRPNRTSRIVERNLMTIHISSPTGNEEIHNTVDGVDHTLDIVACPECSMAAAMQWRDRIESTDGPLDTVRITCVNRHWFMMPVDALSERFARR